MLKLDFAALSELAAGSAILRYSEAGGYFNDPRIRALRLIRRASRT